MKLSNTIIQWHLVDTSNYFTSNTQNCMKTNIKQHKISTIYIFIRNPSVQLYKIFVKLVVFLQLVKTLSVYYGISIPCYIRWNIRGIKVRIKYKISDQ